MAELPKLMYILSFIVVYYITVSCNAASSPLFEPGTTTFPEGERHRVNLKIFSITFPFYGSTYTDMYISKDGMIGFSDDVGFNYVTLGSDTISVRLDKPFIAPFRFSGLAVGANPQGQYIYYRTLQLAGSSDELKNISSFIRSSVVGASQFEATWAMIVTWQNVVSTIDVSQNCISAPTPCPNNTFQAVVLTDQTSSFAIFNYQKMDMTNINQYQAGFNGGRGRGWTEVLSQTDLKKANTLTGSSVTGRFAYKISGEQIIRGGCLYSTSSKLGHLETYPTYAGMFGGEMLEISGQCLQQNDMSRIKCKFGDDPTLVTSGYAINSMKAKCAVPSLYERGLVMVSMSIDGGNYYGTSTYITIVHPSRVKKYITLPYNGKLGGWNETSPSYLTLNWDNDDYKLTNDTSSLVNVRLVGYREDSNQVIWQNLMTLGTNIRVSNGTCRFRVRDFDCFGSSCSKFEIGYVEVRLVNETNANKYRSLTSGVLPLGWFMNSAMFSQYGQNWPQSKCMNWYNADKSDMSWMNDLLYCPCNLQQAIVDIGRWQPDVGCNMFKPTPNMCHFHIGAVHCVRAVQPTSKGSGNQCCYGKDGLLRYAADSYQGSTPDRSHDWGAYPYNAHDLVPSLSHWKHDVITFYYCCLWTGYKYCDYYMDQRATRDCNGYKVPRAAMIYGQGHVSTLDNAKYRMCSEGDYVLMKGPGFSIQGRFQYSATPGIVNNMSVILTNVAIHIINSETIELRLRHPSIDRSTKLVDVLVNKTYHFFNNKEIYWQDFREGAVVNTDLGQTNMQSNFTVIMKNGIGIQAADQNNIMYVTVFVPPGMKGQVSGMLGTWNDNITDDLSPMKNATPSNARNADDLFQNFQYSWRVQSQSDSIMPHSLMVDNNTNLCLLSPPALSNANQRCFGNVECVFDMQITGNLTDAGNTKRASDWMKEMRSFLQPMRSCGLLDVPRSMKDNYNYTLGSTVTLTGCKTGSLSGHTTYMCAPSGNATQMWSPSVTATCQVTVEGANVGMIVGIVVAVVVFLVIMVIIVCVVRKTRKKNSGDKYRSDTPKSPSYDPTYSEVKRDEDNLDDEPKRRPSKELTV